MFRVWFHLQSLFAFAMPVARVWQQEQTFGSWLWVWIWQRLGLRILRNQLPSTASTYYSYHHRCQAANEYPAEMFGLIGFVFSIEWFMGRLCLSMLLLAYPTFWGMGDAFGPPCSLPQTLPATCTRTMCRFVRFGNVNSDISLFYLHSHITYVPSTPTHHCSWCRRSDVVTAVCLFVMDKCFPVP